MNSKRSTSKASTRTQALVLQDTGLILAALKGQRGEQSPRQPAAYARTLLDPKTERLLNTQAEILVLQNTRMPSLRFAPQAYVRAGAGGIVLQCLHEKIDALNYALKVNRPSLYPKTADSEQRTAELHKATAEYLKHAPLSHPNVCRALSHSELDISTTGVDSVKVSATLMEWIDGGSNLQKYLTTKCHTWADVVSVFAQTFAALAYVHEQGLIHWDIKSDNIQVDRTGCVKLTDFGNCRYVSAGKSGDESQSSDWNVPPVLINFRKGNQLASSKRSSFTLPDASWDSPWLDMWMLAREFNRLLEADTSVLALDAPFTKAAEKYLYDADRAKQFLGRCFPRVDDDAVFAVKYLRVLLRRLLHPRTPTSTRFYGKAGEVVSDVAKLTPEFGAAQSVPEVRAVPQHVIRLPHWGNAPFSRRVGKLYNCTPLRRLSKHLQLATVAHVYPGASHRRHEHVAGVMAATIEYVRALYSDRTEPFWRLTITAQDIEALIVAALLHDVGHFAFAHFLEEMGGLFRGYQHEDYIMAVLDIDRARHFGPDIARACEEDRKAIDYVLKKYWAVSDSEMTSFRHRVAHIIQLPTHSGTSPVIDPAAVLHIEHSNRLKLEILHSILSSSIDADKCDYLVRDALHCGVPYALAIDMDRFYQSLTTIPFLPQDAPFHTPREDGMCTEPSASIGVTDKGVLPVESILLARYHMFSSVYWHHTARAESAMLQYVVGKIVYADTEDAIRRNLEELVQCFRDHDDAWALDWCAQKLAARTSGDNENALRMLAALSGTRKGLYWTAFQLQYEGPDQEVRESAKKFNHVLSKCFGDVHMKNQRKATLDKLAELRKDFQDAMCEAINRDLSARAGSLSAHSRGNQRRARGPRAQLTDGDILLDIPPAGMDQVGNIFVSDSAGHIRSIRRMSPVADAVADAFIYWVRRVRVFLSRPAWNRCNELGLNDVDVQRVCASVMERFVEGQLNLFESATDVRMAIAGGKKREPGSVSV